ncbi:hypothetical protein L2E82_27091 [Cichorium intybus]|uniref:Uncharacterized protein n=1 Tax=Cichorium intybus TaxID=13427 RepID=A0ACB9CS98_CICIN|nr:hypothetical protein L2E82_27091 [Cichorium intybus]
MFVSIKNLFNDTFFWHTAQPKKLKRSGRGGDKEICCRLGYFNQNLRNSVLVSPPAVRGPEEKEKASIN